MSQPVNSWINSQHIDDINSDRLSNQLGSHVTDSDRRNFSDDHYRNRSERRDNERSGDSSDRWGVRSRGRVRDVSPGMIN